MKTAWELRSFIVDFLRKELEGPDPGDPAIQLDGEELLRRNSSPRLRYGTAVLFPQKSSHSAQEVGSSEEGTENNEDSNEDEPNSESTPSTDDAPGLTEADDQTEQEISLANEYLPSAMGLSALVELPEILVVKVRAAQYKQDEFPNLSDRPKQNFWLRKPLERELEFTRAELEESQTEKPVSEDTSGGGLHVHIVSRPDEGSPDERLITITLVNRTMAGDGAPSDEDCYFQCGISVYARGNEACFQPYPEKETDTSDSDAARMQLLYRKRRVYAAGHGCGPEWSENDNGKADRIWSDFLPSYEVKPIRPRPDLEDVELSMQWLAKATVDDVLASCRRLASSYRNWLYEKEKEIAGLEEKYKLAARRNFKDCRECLERIESGTGELGRNSKAFRAFQLMNEAMFRQQKHYKISSEQIRNWEKDRNTGVLKPVADFVEPDYSEEPARWYPFQLAFVLMNIRSIVDPECSERSIVDTIWFPTGGGKTEAYLGISAFTLFFRRLTNPENAGTTVLMRYTLRLLTTQQFQRACSLIAACEVIRRKEGSQILGNESFAIGLWVGKEVTPNDHAEAKSILNSLLRSKGNNKFVLLSCPWCGLEMGPVKISRNKTECKGYRKVGSTVRFICEDTKCKFSDDRGLPVFVVDEDIYRQTPSLIVGTVDKFAMLPWRPQAGSIFGVGKQHSPPDLIIQDELHLISGPLGSMVGLYETLVDLLSKDKNGYKGKIVASTATISRADEQVKALYGRRSALFPPQALDAGESFFAFEDREATGRLYIGVMATALPSHVTSQVRTVSALLQAVPMGEASVEAMDAYWTLIGYFNSIRELGHMVTLLGADIVEYMRVIARRKLAWTDPEQRKLKRYINNHIELTGRVPSAMLPGRLQWLFTEYTGTSPLRALDVCLATNMIQVGIDVSRLSLMMIIGQPKTTSEYIQASSRIGRDKNRPGLVIANLNPSKPRDRSHFEHFRQYHQSIYKYVEPTSVTPFAVPVRERALHAIVTTLVRLWGDEELAKSPDRPIPQDLIDRIKNVVLDRVKDTEPEELKGTEASLNYIFLKWKEPPKSKYGDFNQKTEEPIPLMYQSGRKPFPAWQERSFETPTSMRSVDATCEARIISEYDQN